MMSSFIIFPHSLLYLISSCFEEFEILLLSMTSIMRYNVAKTVRGTFCDRSLHYISSYSSVLYSVLHVIVTHIPLHLFIKKDIARSFHGAKINLCEPFR